MRQKNNRKAFRAITMAVMVSVILQSGGCQFLNGAKADYKKGIKEFNNSNYSEAADYFKKAVKAEPDRALYSISYGMALAELGEYSQAQSQFDGTISDKDNKIVRENNKKAYRGKGICYFLAKDYQNAVVYFEKALNIQELDNMDLDILEYEGDAECFLGNYEKAAEIYSSVITKKGYDSAFYIKRAYAYEKAGETDKALNDYDVVVKKDSDDVQAYIGAYLLLSGQDREDEAEQYLTKAADGQDKSENASYINAVEEYYKGDTDAAADGLSKALENDISEAGYYLAMISSEAGDFEKAESYLQNYLKEESGSFVEEAYSLLGDCYYQQENYEDALKEYEKGVAYNDAATLQQFMKKDIVTNERLGNYETADKKATDYLNKYPDDEEMKKEAEFIKTRLL